MLFPLDDSLLTKGFCRGEDRPRLDDESRLCLGRDTVGVLTTHNVKTLYRCPDPTGGGRFILCPDKHWRLFVKAVMRHFARSPDADTATRLLCCATPAAVDGQGRVKITLACLDYAHIGPGTRVRLLGVGYYYEISRLP
jgi:DNA-binding transcriptional regulator/RsmH inhibitor MraZ